MFIIYNKEKIDYRKNNLCTGFSNVIEAGICCLTSGTNPDTKKTKENLIEEYLDTDENGDPCISIKDGDFNDTGKTEKISYGIIQVTDEDFIRELCENDFKIDIEKEKIILGEWKNTVTKNDRRYIGSKAVSYKDWKNYAVNYFMEKDKKIPEYILDDSYKPKDNKLKGKKFNKLKRK